MNLQGFFFFLSQTFIFIHFHVHACLSLSHRHTDVRNQNVQKTKPHRKFKKNCFGIYRMAQWNWELREGYAFVGDGGKGTQLIPARKCFASFETRSLKARLSLVALLFSPPLSRLAHVLQPQ